MKQASVLTGFQQAYQVQQDTQLEILEIMAGEAAQEW
jgi:hypothetical protein